MEELHGHELIDLIIRQNKPVGLEDIKKLAEKELGRDTLYFTCQHNNMTTDDLIQFLIDKEKLVPKDDGYVIVTKNICEE